MIDNNSNEAKDLQPDLDDAKLSEDYLKLNEKCDLIINKIKKRKRRTKND